MVAVRHWCGGGGEQKSTLILLCEDGSLRMYAASQEHTGYWLSPAIQPTHAPRRRPRLVAHHAKGKAQQVCIYNTGRHLKQKVDVGQKAARIVGTGPNSCAA